MRNFLSKPHNCLLLTIPVLLVIQVLGILKVILYPPPSASMWCICLFLLLWLIASRTSPFMFSQTLSWISVGTLVVSIFIFLLLTFTSNAGMYTPLHINLMYASIFYLPGVALLITILNLAMGLPGRKKHPEKGI